MRIPANSQLIPSCYWTFSCLIKNLWVSLQRLLAFKLFSGVIRQYLIKGL